MTRSRLSRAAAGSLHIAAAIFAVFAIGLLFIGVFAFAVLSCPALMLERAAEEVRRG